MTSLLKLISGFRSKNIHLLHNIGRRQVEFNSLRTGYCSSHIKSLRSYCTLRRIQLTPKYVQPLINIQQKNCHISTSEVISRMKANATPELKMFKLETPAFKSIFNPELETLIGLFKKYKHELRIAGGAVRDLLSGKVPHDVDFATTATPDEMKALFEAEGIRMLNMKGEEHGTITCRINDKENFEVTTLRIDVLTDGRHAEVEFTKDWELDSLRRDLTINSMFLGFDGTVYDYFSGSEDLSNRKVRFVGKAEQRIQEDYLRILRYFRFYGRIAENEENHDADTLKTIHDNVGGLKGISGERIWTEIKKILEGRFAGPILKVMLQLDVGKYIGLPSNCNVSEMEKIYKQSKDLALKPMTIIAALLETEEELTALHERVKMSREELRLGLFILTHRNDDMTDDVFAYCQDRLCDLTGSKDAKTRERVYELMKYCNQRDVLENLKQWKEPKFPLNGFKLLEAGVPKGPSLAKVLDAVREKWKESRYTSTEEQLLSELEDILKDFKVDQ